MPILTELDEAIIIVNQKKLKERADHNFDNLPDADIWNEFRLGNEAAFDFIYQKNYDRLYNYGCQFTPDQALVEDVIQELFVELRRRSAHLSETNNILPYLYSAFRRKIIRLRDKGRRNQEFDVEKSFAITASIEHDIVSAQVEKENLQRLKTALYNLPEKHREIIFHFYYENLSYSEIQEIIGFDNIKSVRNLLYKALKSLRKGFIPILLLFALHLSITKNES